VNAELAVVELGTFAQVSACHEQLGPFLLRGLRIGASTVSIVELLRNDWTGGIRAGVA